MKIGILTFHRALNYGAVLQCYALTRYLMDCGHDVEVVDYRPYGVEKYRQYFPRDLVFGRKGLLMKIKGFVVSILLIGKKRKASKAFDCFLNKFLTISERIDINTTAKLKKYDYLIMGSDQVWSPTICDGLDPIYWGNFPHNGIKLITYAASIGGHNTISADMWKEIGEYIKNYSAISVRETNLYNELVERFSLSVNLVVDPTILLPESKFDILSIKPRENNYVLLFNLDSDNRASYMAVRVANYYQCGVISLSALKEFKHSPEGITDKYSVTPLEFLGYFKYAKFIITSSFHGTVFSVVFRKNFYSLRWEQSDRAYSFLKSLRLESRMISKETTIDIPTKVDYTGVDGYMGQNRTQSEQFISANLS